MSLYMLVPFRKCNFCSDHGSILWKVYQQRYIPYHSRMAKGNRKRFNKSGRDQSLKTTVGSNLRVLDSSRTGQDSTLSPSNVEDSNALIIEHKEVVRRREEPVKRKLSKKRRKQLERLLDQKEKKANRGELLERLGELRVPAAELAQYRSVAHIGNSKQHQQSNSLAKRPDIDIEIAEKLNAIKGAKRPKFHKWVEPESASSSSDSEGSEEADETDKDTTNEASDLQICESTNMDHEISTPSEQAVKIMWCPKNDVEKPAEKKILDPRLDWVSVARPEEIQEGRLALPILSEEGPILEAISENDVILLCGETGSGKTTQIPQFLYEAGYTSRGVIGMTEPRRIAAISAAERIRYEMVLKEPIVAHHIRYETRVTNETKIAVLTDGVLLNQMASDFLLDKYSVIILDEAHERSVHTDILLGMLSRVVMIRRKRGRPLKLIIMSATLRVDDFVNNGKLFPNKTPPVLKIESRQFPVTTSFAKRTELNDYIAAAYKKVCKIHREEPKGGILVFVTGQDEVRRLVKRLEETFPRELTVEPKKEQLDLDTFASVPAPAKTDDTESDEGIYHLDEDDDEFGECDDFDEEKSYEITTTALDKTLPMVALPLYSVLPRAEQKKIFEECADPIRKVVVATNVAETSLTIPGIKYVVDTGRHKEKVYSTLTGVTKFEVKWISQAAADQRAGRSGRTGPGRCYRLFSSAVFQDFPKFPPPEIVQKPLDDLVLGMKSFGIDQIKNFPFVTAPDAQMLSNAERLCVKLGALEGSTEKNKISGHITSLGATISSFPVSPRFGRILSLSAQCGLLNYAIALVAACTVRDMIDHTNEKMKALKQIWTDSTKVSLGDLLVFLSAIGSTEASTEPDRFAAAIGLRQDGLREIHKLRRLIHHTVRPLMKDGDTALLQRKISPPDATQCRLLAELFLSGFGDQIAFRTDEENEYKISNDSVAQIHPHSVLVKKQASIVMYQEKSKNQKGNVYLKGCAIVTPDQVIRMATGYCKFIRVKTVPAKFDAEVGNIIGLYKVSYIPVSKELGEHWKELVDDNETLLRCLTHALLDGQIFSSFKNLSNKWLSPPAVLLRPWSNLHPRTSELITCFSQLGIDSRMSLIRTISNDQSRGVLITALRAWVLPTHFTDLDNVMNCILKETV